MAVDLQKGSMLKRISALMFDTIILGIFAVAVAFVLSAVLGYDAHQATLNNAYLKYETEYGIDFEIGDEYYDLTSEEKANYDAAYNALINDNEAMYAYNMVINLTLVIISISVLVANLVLNFIMPLLIGEGRTVGKKIFGLAVCRVDAVRITAPILFIRTVLGVYTVETMIPILIFIMLMFNMIGLEGTLVLLGILLLELCLLIFTKTNSCIHDILAKTVVVDNASQRIFENEGELVAYKQRLAAEKADKSAYF